MNNFMDLKFKQKRTSQVSMLLGLKRRKDQMEDSCILIEDFIPTSNEDDVINRMFTEGPSRRALIEAKSMVDKICSNDLRQMPKVWALTLSIIS